MIADSEMRTAQALFDLQTIVADQQKLIDYLVRCCQSYHGALLAHDERLTAVEAR
ncbi:hypothetical protein OG579_20420 [Williamsia herbipolensis]|uniref:Uncharacterized protein n=1 Tax=Williamsia herbipolensis TaxID=1603258 RepID=A0AAU4K1V8_9NOCA|nr:hypothetical protein [Williamsia herbipolensis]